MRYVLLSILGVVSLFGLGSGLFIINQTEQVLVTEFGKLNRSITKPGLHWCIPIIQKITRYEKRVMSCDTSEIELTLSDQKRIIVSIFERFYIENPELFYKTVQTQEGVQQRLDVIIKGELRNILGKHTLAEVLYSKRHIIELELSQKVRESAKVMGIGIMDVRLKAVLYPAKNRDAVLQRMRSERQREAQEWRGKAAKISSEIKSEADLRAAELLAQANRESKALIGNAEAESLQAKLGLYDKNRLFTNRILTLSSYIKALHNSEIILSTDHKYLSGLEELSQIPSPSKY